MFPAILQPYESVLCIVGHAEILLNNVLHWINCTLLIGDCWTNLGKETTTTKYNKQTSTHIAYIGHISHMWSQFVLLGQTFATLRGQRAQRAQACVPPPPPLLGSSSSLSSAILSSSATPCIHGKTCLLKHIGTKPQGKMFFRCIGPK